MLAVYFWDFTVHKLRTLADKSHNSDNFKPWQVTEHTVFNSDVVSFTVLHSSYAQREHAVSFQLCPATEQLLVGSLDCHCWVLKMICHSYSKLSTKQASLYARSYATISRLFHKNWVILTRQTCPQDEKTLKINILCWTENCMCFKIQKEVRTLFSVLLLLLSPSNYARLPWW